MNVVLVLSVPITFSCPGVLGVTSPLTQDVAIAGPVEITLFASHGDLILGDTKEGTMSLRLAETMRLKGKTGRGHIVMSTGVRDEETWGKRADWVDYYGPVNGVVVGAAMLV